MRHRAAACWLLLCTRLACVKLEEPQMGQSIEQGTHPTRCTDAVLIRQLSNRQCIPAKTFGCEQNDTSKMWVSDGCRGRFRCREGGPMLQCGDYRTSRRIGCSCYTLPKTIRKLMQCAGIGKLDQDAAMSRLRDDGLVSVGNLNLRLATSPNYTFTHALNMEHIREVLLTGSCVNVTSETSIVSSVERRPYRMADIAHWRAEPNSDLFPRQLCDGPSSCGVVMCLFTDRRRVASIGRSELEAIQAAKQLRRLMRREFPIELFASNATLLRLKLSDAIAHWDIFHDVALAAEPMFQLLATAQQRHDRRVPWLELAFLHKLAALWQSSFERSLLLDNDVVVLDAQLVR